MDGKDLFEDLKTSFTNMSYKIQIGVIATTDSRKNEKGVTNSELMFIHENGSPLAGIPARPVLKYAIEDANEKDGLIDKTLDRIFDGIENKGWTHKDVENEMKILGERIASNARNIIRHRDERLAPNSPATIERKGSDLPLLDTGQLSRSITSVVEKKKV